MSREGMEPPTVAAPGVSDYCTEFFGTVGVSL
jgi:hypothetical protein